MIRNHWKKVESSEIINTLFYDLNLHIIYIYTLGGLLLNPFSGLLLDSELKMTPPGLETFLGPFSDVGRGGNDLLSVQAATEVVHQLLDILHGPRLESPDLLETDIHNQNMF